MLWTEVSWYSRIAKQSWLMSRVWWCTPIIPALRWPRQKNLEFEVSLGYLGKPCLKKKGGWGLGSSLMVEYKAPGLIPSPPPAPPPIKEPNWDL
jgi:hypothetical protein